MAVGGFDAIVGNPPFQGGQKITGALGTDYRDHLGAWLADGRRGSADLVAYFLLRAAALLREGGGFGVLATNTIGQGDSREVGLDQLDAGGWTITRAIASRPWPGGASLEVAHLWLRQGNWAAGVWLEDESVRAITSALTPRSRVRGPVHRLAANAGRSFIGSYVLGLGFVLTPAEAAELIRLDPRNAQVVKPYLTGKDLNLHPDQSPSRWIIDSQDWPLTRARGYPKCLEIVERLVKPQRDQVARKANRERWWIYAEARPGMRRAIAGLDRIVVRALTGKHHALAFVGNDRVVDQTAPVFAYDDDGHFAVLSSTIHGEWAAQHGATLRNDLRYTPSDCFETFTQPDLTPEVARLGGRLDDHRRALMLDRQEGLTKTYNRVHDATDSSNDIAELRAIHEALDHAVAAAYGWSDLTLDHGFHPTRQGVRFTFSEPQRVEVLDRLLELNQERYADEVRRGLHDKGAKAKRRRSRQAPAGQDAFRLS